MLVLRSAHAYYPRVCWVDVLGFEYVLLEDSVGDDTRGSCSASVSGLTMVNVAYLPVVGCAIDSGKICCRDRSRCLGVSVAGCVAASSSRHWLRLSRAHHGAVAETASLSESDLSRSTRQSRRSRRKKQSVSVCVAHRRWAPRKVVYVQSMRRLI